ncbi:hypothetical protein D9757_006065 [Collybiopsis confluens]|uniref:Uncharacterized protein n=1 Tax=Collybiopsis confluens TaxID=2823264 RepID=A0A8H5HUM3_9AGAR|nr:hypothetical protein D9757_006065 [Collybiopsis confluens]
MVLMNPEKLLQVPLVYNIIMAGVEEIIGAVNSSLTVKMFTESSDITMQGEPKFYVAHTMTNIHYHQNQDATGRDVSIPSMESAEDQWRQLDQQDVWLENKVIVADNRYYLCRATLSNKVSEGKEGKALVKRFHTSVPEKDFVAEVRFAQSFFHPYIMQMFAASKKNAPSKFLVYTTRQSPTSTYEVYLLGELNPAAWTYIEFHKSKEMWGQEYVDFSQRYEQSFSDARNFLKHEVDGLALTRISIQTRTVDSKGYALIMVPMWPSGQTERVKFLKTVLETHLHNVSRREQISREKKVVRCPKCLPSTKPFYMSLAKVSASIRQDLIGYEDVHQSTELIPLFQQLQNTSERMKNVACDVVDRSLFLPSYGRWRCGFCGEYWGIRRGQLQYVGHHAPA